MVVCVVATRDDFPALLCSAPFPPKKKQQQQQIRELHHEVAHLKDRNRTLKQQLQVRKQKMDELREAAQDLLDEYYAVVSRPEESDPKPIIVDGPRELENPEEPVSKSWWGNVCIGEGGKT